MPLPRRDFLKLAVFLGGAHAPLLRAFGSDPVHPFGSEFPDLDSLVVGEWWNKPFPPGATAPPSMRVPREEVVAFALYTCERGVLKLTAQLYPLLPDESRTVRLELRRAVEEAHGERARGVRRPARGHGRAVPPERHGQIGRAHV